LESIEITIFKTGQPVSMNKIEWWLLKYEDVFETIERVEKNKRIYNCQVYNYIKVLLFGKPDDNSKFINLYKSLDKLSMLHRYENYFLNELNKHNKINQNHSLLKAWATKNKHMGIVVYGDFFVDVLTYNKPKKNSPLKVKVNKLKEFDIIIDREEFKNTIEFLNIFNDLFWKQNILPEEKNKLQKLSTKNKPSDYKKERMRIEIKTLENRINDIIDGAD